MTHLNPNLCQIARHFPLMNNKGQGRKTNKDQLLIYKIKTKKINIISKTNREKRKKIIEKSNK